MISLFRFVSVCSSGKTMKQLKKIKYLPISLNNELRCEYYKINLMNPFLIPPFHMRNTLNPPPHPTLPKSELLELTLGSLVEGNLEPQGHGCWNVVHLSLAVFSYF